MVISLVFIAIYILAIVMGMVRGFGKVLEVVTKGIIGKIAAVVICYTIFGLVLSLPFVQELLNTLTMYLRESGFLGRIISYVKIELIILAVALYFIVRILLNLAAKLVDAIISADNTIMKIINKSLGVVFSLAFTTIIILLIFQLVSIFPGLRESVYGALQHTFLGLDRIFINNPLNSIIMSFIR